MGTNQVDLPRFKYLPNAYELGLFKEEDFTCDICDTKQQYRYVGAYYMEKDNSKGTFKVTDINHKICVHCIKDGKAAEKLNADFKDAEILEQACYNKEHIDEETCQSVLRTWLYETPEIGTEIWPICCSDFTKFIGYLGKGQRVIDHIHLENEEDLSTMTARLEDKTIEELYSELNDAFKNEAKRLKKEGFKVRAWEWLKKILARKM